MQLYGYLDLSESILGSLSEGRTISQVRDVGYVALVFSTVEDLDWIL
jgi:hypothetical protein